MAKLPKHHDGAEHRFFLLTLLRNGRVKADRIRTDDDPRLRSRAAFALITLASVLPKDEELNLADPAGRIGCSTADANDEGYLLRPRIANSIDDFRGLFHALRRATEDTILEIDRKGRLGAEWRVCANRTWVN
jgi:hypothetical protein